MTETCSVTTTLSSRAGLPSTRLLCRIKDHVLGADYELSVAFVGDRRSQTLNKKYRHTDAPTNVLSFPLAIDAGEVIVNPRRAVRDAKKCNHTPHEHIVYLFIHGVLHLKGLSHGSTMESEEKRLLRKFV